jgi:hypothetical protein
VEGGYPGRWFFDSLSVPVVGVLPSSSKNATAEQCDVGRGWKIIGLPDDVHAIGVPPADGMLAIGVLFLFARADQKTRSNRLSTILCSG